MRQLFKQQLSLNIPANQELIGKLNTRDDIDKLIEGLSAIFDNQRLRDQMIKKIQNTLNLSSTLGREGMNYWTMFVFGVVRVALNIDYDRLQNLVNNHIDLRRIVGLGDLDSHHQYGLTALKTNLRLFTPELLEEINTLTVAYGRQLIHPYSKQTKLSARADSYVAETNVHFPTDISLLYDATRKIIELVGKLSRDQKKSGWRQYKHNRNILKKLMHKARASKKRSSEYTLSAYHKYIDIAQALIDKAQAQLSVLTNAGHAEIDHYLDCANKLIDQIDRRVIKGETIPHNDKIFSVFEPHTEWISKGKAGVPVEFGIKLAIVQDQNQFILHHHVMENQQDVDIAVDLAHAIEKKYGKIDSISFDRGFWSPANDAALREMIRQVVLPKKGYRNQERLVIEEEKEFKKLRKKHSAIESGIHALEAHGLDKIPDNGIDGYKRYVAFGIVGYNIHRLGSLLMHKQKAAERRHAA